MSDALIGVARPRIDAPDKVTGATRFAADGYVHGLLHARPVLATEAHARIRGIDGSAALARPRRRRRSRRGRSPHHVEPAPTARPSRSRARRSCSPASPSHSSSPRSEAAAEDGAELVVVDYEPLAAVVDVEAAMEVGCRARTDRRGDGRRGRRPRVDPRRRRPRPGGRPRRGALGERARPHHARAGRRRRGVRVERGGRRGDVPDAVGLPGVSRAAGLHRLARALGHARRLDEHAGLVRHAARARPRVRPAARARPGDRRAARRRVRRQVRPRRAARGRRRARAEAARPARAHALRGLPGDEPGLGAGDAPEDRRPGRRHADRDRGADDRRPRLECRLGRRGHQLAPRRRPVQLGGARPARLRRPDEPLHVRRLSRAGSADRRLRARVAPRRARDGPGARPDRASPDRTPSSRATSVSAAIRIRSSARGRCSSGSASTRSGRRATRSRRTKGSAWQLVTGPEGSSRQLPSAGWTPTGR